MVHVLTHVKAEEMKRRKSLKKIPVVIVPGSARSSLTVCTETQRMVNKLVGFYSDQAGYRISANSVIHLLAENALQELGVPQ